MASFRPITAEFAVSPQLALDDLAAARAQGFELVINNRPDGEAPEQPDNSVIAAAARAQGLDYIHIPVIGRPTAQQAQEVAEAAHGRRTLAFCRSGTRSAMTWAMGEAASGRMSLQEVTRAAAGAGYDLGPALGRR
jgi:uncharacterized protein (TIGR01244 family)